MTKRVTFQDCPYTDYTYSQRMAWSQGHNEALAASARGLDELRSTIGRLAGFLPIDDRLPSDIPFAEITKHIEYGPIAIQVAQRMAQYLDEGA